MTPSVPEPRWRRLPEERPQQIMLAALEVFEEHGLSGARLEDIAKRAGVSKGTIYLYFPNKEALFREMILTTVVAAIEKGEQLPEGKNATAQLKVFMRGYWAFVRSPSFATIFRLIVGEIHRFPDLAEFHYNEVVIRARRLMERILTRGINAGEFRQIAPDTAARMLSALFSTTAVWCNKRAVLPHVQMKTDDEIFDELVDFYLHAIQA